jgi:hypothetical protein
MLDRSNLSKMPNAYLQQMQWEYNYKKYDDLKSDFIQYGYHFLFLVLN